MTCVQSVDRSTKTLVVYKPTDKACEFTSIEIPETGGELSSGTVQISGNLLIYPWVENENGRELKLRIRNTFAGAGLIRFEKSSSVNGQDWVTLQIGEEHRDGTGSR